MRGLSRLLAFPDQSALCFGQRVLGHLSGGKILPEARHEPDRLLVGDLPERRHDRTGAGLLKGLSQTRDAFTARESARVTGAQYDELGTAEIEPGDLQAGQHAVVAIRIGGTI